MWQTMLKHVMTLSTAMQTTVTVLSRSTVPSHLGWASKNHLEHTGVIGVILRRSDTFISRLVRAPSHGGNWSTYQTLTHGSISGSIKVTILQEIMAHAYSLGT
jgi:hypothetical protein